MEVLDFQLKYERVAENFVYFTRDGVDLMFEAIAGEGRRWLTCALEKPFGRGVNFQLEVNDINSMYAKVKELAANSIYLDFEVKQYARSTDVIEQAQFIVQDPDGYLFRFCSKI